MQKTSIPEMHRLTVEQFHEAEKMPLIVVLDDVRSLYNVGSVFRTADAFRVEAIYLCGITATPDTVYNPDGTILRDCSLKASQEIHKTALGAENSVAWRYFADYNDCIRALRAQHCTILAVEQCHGSTMLNDFIPNDKGESAPYPTASLSPKYQNINEAEGVQRPLAGGGAPTYAVILGNEVKGVHQDLIDQCDGCLEIPQYGTKHSLNVSVTGGIIIHHFATHLLK